jgi:hypothetical protein
VVCYFEAEIAHQAAAYSGGWSENSDKFLEVPSQTDYAFEHRLGTISQAGSHSIYPSS